MTEADCRELWRILQGLEREFQEMKSIADDWFTVHGKGNGCFAALAMMALIPVGAIYGICQMLLMRNGSAEPAALLLVEGNW